MLHDFLAANHQELITLCRDKAKLRFEPSLDPEAIDHGVPMFLKQLGDILRHEQTTDERHETDSKPSPTPAPTAIGRAAALHGSELLRLGFTVDQVVHGYGDVCQAVTGLAVEQHKVISTDEFRTLNRCLDNAIADAVTSYACNDEHSEGARAGTLAERLDDFASEHLRLVDITTNAYAAMKSGNVGTGGATGLLLVHALQELRLLPQRILPEIRALADKKAKATNKAAASKKAEVSS